MNRKIFILLIVVALNSCGRTNRNSIVKDIEVDFTKNSSEFLFIKEYMISNSDSVIGINITRKNEVSFNTIYSIDKTVLPIQMKDNSEFLKYIKDTCSFRKVVRIMKSKDFISISRNNEGINIGYDKVFPCCELVYCKNDIDSILWIQELIDNYQFNQEKHWAYRLNDNWYIRGMPCFN